MFSLVFVIVLNNGSKAYPKVKTVWQVSQCIANILVLYENKLNYKVFLKFISKWMKSVNFYKIYLALKLTFDKAGAFLVAVGNKI